MKLILFFISWSFFVLLVLIANEKRSELEQDKQDEISQRYQINKFTEKDLKQQYEIKETVLGTGGFGKVYEGVHRKDPSHRVAIKVIDKKNMKET